MSKLKSIKSVVRRIGLMSEFSDEDLAKVQHMIESVVRNRDNIIKKQEGKLKERIIVLSEKRVSGVIRNTIKAHGPITKHFISSASKRIVGALQQVIEPNNCEENDANSLNLQGKTN